MTNNIYKGPLKIIPPELYDDYTINNNIKVYNDWIDESCDGDETFLHWDTHLIDNIKNNYSPANIKNNTYHMNDKWKYGGEPYPDHRIGGACKLLNSAFNKYNIYINNKNIAVIGSKLPWIESMLLNYNINTVTTVEYNVPFCEHNKIKTISYYNEFIKNDYKYDAIISYSSIEHSGLGRYGDILDPNGDIKTMDDIYNKLSNDGILILGIPIGNDALVWNLHRIYGIIRLPLLTQKFEILEWIGSTFDECLKLPKGSDWKSFYQPILILKKKN